MNSVSITTASDEGLFISRIVGFNRRPAPAQLNVGVGNKDTLIPKDYIDYFLSILQIKQKLENKMLYLLFPQFLPSRNETLMNFYGGYLMEVLAFIKYPLSIGIVQD